MGPKLIRTDVLIKRDICKDIEDTEGCRPCSGGEGDWSNAATNRGIPGVASHHRRLGEAGRESSPEPSEGGWLCCHLDFGLRLPDL